MLQGAAAAGAEVRTGRGDPPLALGQPFQHLALEAAAALAGQTRAHAVARHREWQEDRAPLEGPDTVATPADRLDGQLDLPRPAGPRPTPHEISRLSSWRSYSKGGPWFGAFRFGAVRRRPRARKKKTNRPSTVR